MTEEEQNNRVANAMYQALKVITPIVKENLAESFSVTFIVGGKEYILSLRPLDEANNIINNAIKGDPT